MPGMKGVKSYGGAVSGKWGEQFLLKGLWADTTGVLVNV